ncbi:MAG: iron-containing alcohol dehydrogenase [Actinomycetia bacterium]|nr:iron-containing alcohol dehydrogenase [Actinomycetes bacterium]
MKNFEFNMPTKVIFGKDTEKNIGPEIKKYTDKVLFHYGGGSIKANGLYDKVLKSLRQNDIEFVELAGVKPNPRLSLVKEGIKLCRENNIEFILGVGGGSVLDSAKAIAIGVPYQGDVWDFYTDKATIEEALPVGAVLTIPAAGSEASNGSVITDDSTDYKRPAESELIRPRFAVMNPEVTFTLPPYQTVCGASDIMAHVFERYFTRVKNVDLTDRLCESVLKTMIKYTPQVLEEPENYDARAEIMWTGTVAHNDLLTTGRQGDWGSHMIEHELSAIYDIAHGAGLSIVFPAWMKYVFKTDVERFVQFAARVWNVEPDLFDMQSTALEGISRLEQFYKKINLPTRLSDINIGDDRFEEMADKAVEFGNLGSFVELKKEDVLSILKLAK